MIGQREIKGSCLEVAVGVVPGKYEDCWQLVILPMV